MTQIICRADINNNPIVFLADSYNDGRLLAWKPTFKKPESVSIDTYRLSRPITEADAETLKKQYEEKTRDHDAIIRARLPRKYRVLKNIFDTKENDVQVRVKEKAKDPSQPEDDKNIKKQELMKMFEKMIDDLL